MKSQRIFNSKNIAKDMHSLSSLDPITGIYILQEWNRATIYVNCVRRLHGGLLIYVPLCKFIVVWGETDADGWQSFLFELWNNKSCL